VAQISKGKVEAVQALYDSLLAKLATTAPEAVAQYK
jgi:hypothetical protein